MKRAGGFTLIELLVVIAVMGILAGITISVLGPISDTKKRKGMEADLKRLVTAIENYKAKFHHYPPDNNDPRNFDRDWMHPLYYELTGTLVVNTTQFQPVDGVRQALDGGPGAHTETFLGVRGFVNSSTKRPDVKVFLTDLRPVHLAQARTGPDIYLLTAAVPGPNKNLVTPGGQPFNPWRYNSSNPTNNPGKFDLWAEVVIGKQTNVIGNWHK
ncbi:MAG: type II secretion system protein [Verrucomicrobia bacterium]|nr:type II secretion system protein [Verrucomicrobiota bacterium]